MALKVNRTLRLPTSEYFLGLQRKTGIAIHHTAGTSILSAVEGWREDPQRIATAYLIGKFGDIDEVFDPAAWAWQFGLDWPDEHRIAFEKRFIGIELVSLGGLTEHDGHLYACEWLPEPIRVEQEFAFDAGRDYRGFRWFDRFPSPQLHALAALVDELCTRFSIPRIYPASPFDYYGEALADFQGVIGHAMVRSGKSDPAPDPLLWETLAKRAGLRPVPVVPTVLDRHALFAENLRRINVMDTAAGSLIKDLLMELQRRGTYLRLGAPVPGAHAVGYQIAEGDAQKVVPIARALGFTRVSDKTLEVRVA